MGLFSSDKAWTTQARNDEKNRRAMQAAKARRAAQARQANRKHMIEHPVSHLSGSIFRSIFR
jgi:hypothetical protein